MDFQSQRPFAALSLSSLAGCGPAIYLARHKPHLSFQTQAAFVLQHFTLTSAFTHKILTLCVCVPPCNYLRCIHTVQLRVGQRHLSEQHLGSPRVQERYIQLAGISACQSSSGFGVGSLHSRRASLLHRQAGCQGQARTQLASGQRCWCCSAPYSIPDAIRARCCSAPYSIPATIRARRCLTAASHFQPPVLHQHSASLRKPRPQWCRLICLFCCRAGEGPQGCWLSPQQRQEAPHVPMSIQHCHFSIGPWPPRCSHQSKQKGIAAATGHKPANYLDPRRFFFLFLNRGTCNFLITLIFLEAEGIQLSKKCSSLVTSKKNNTATELPWLTKLSQLTTGQMKPQPGVVATHRSSP